MTTQVHMKIMERQVRMRLSVPPPGDSRNQPTRAGAVGGGLDLAAVIFSRAALLYASSGDRLLRAHEHKPGILVTEREMLFLDHQDP